MAKLYIYNVSKLIYTIYSIINTFIYTYYITYYITYIWAVLRTPPTLTPYLTPIRTYICTYKGLQPTSPTYTYMGHPPHLHSPYFTAARQGRIHIHIIYGTPQLIRMFSSGNQRTHSASTERVARYKWVPAVKF